MIARARTRFGVAYVLTQFAWLRAALFALVYVATQSFPRRTPNPNRDYTAFGDNPFLDAFFRWDSGWYHRIVDHGYRLDGKQSNVAFFPAYPYLTRWLSYVVHNDWIAGLIVSNLALLGALFFLHGYVFEQQGREAARRAVTFALIFPSTIFFSAYYSEGLFLFAVSGAFYFYQRQNFFAAVAFGMFATLTRSTGIFLCPAFVLAELWRMRRADAPSTKRSIGRIVALGFIPAGLCIFMLVLYVQVDDPLAFMHVQEAWGRSGHHFPLTPIITELSVRFDDIYRTIEAIAAALMVVAVVASFWVSPVAEIVFLALTVLFPLSTGTAWSMLRFAGTAFPLYPMIARATHRPAFERPTIATFTMLASLTAARFALWYWAG